MEPSAAGLGSNRRFTYLLPLGVQVHPAPWGAAGSGGSIILLFGPLTFIPSFSPTLFSPPKKFLLSWSSQSLNELIFRK